MATESSIVYRELKTIINTYRYHSTLNDYHKKLPCKKENVNAVYITFMVLFRNLNSIVY